MTTIPLSQPDLEKISLHNYGLAKSQDDLFAISQALLGLATSPMQGYLTDDDRHRIASYFSDQIEGHRFPNAFDLQAALQE